MFLCSLLLSTQRSQPYHQLAWLLSTVWQGDILVPEVYLALDRRLDRGCLVVYIGNRTGDMVGQEIPLGAAVETVPDVHGGVKLVSPNGQL